MNDDEIRERLRETLASQHGCDTLLSSFICNRCRQSATALLPTVRALISEARTEGYRDAADEPCSAPFYGADTPCVLPDGHAGGCLR